MINILTIGDIVGKCGREIIFKELNNLKEEFNIDFTVVNGENATTGNGINEKYAYMLLENGADIITLGNHSFDKKDIFNMLETSKQIIRPLNIDPNLPGDGVRIFDFGSYKIAVLNLIGQIYLEKNAFDPFSTLKKAVDNLKREHSNINIIVDFHAEATSEKQALAYYMQGEITVFFGTHTHVQTNDARILCGKTGYVTDIGMTGSADSVIGLKKEIAIPRFLGEEGKFFKWAETEPMINGAVFSIDETTGQTKKIELINRRY